MDSVLKFIIKLQADQGNVVSVTTQTSQELDNISRKAKMAGAGIRNAFSFSNFKSSLMSIPGMEFLTNPYVMIGAGLGAITKLGAEAEQTSVAFTTLVGSETKAKDMLAEITQYANATPFGKMDLVNNARTMLNFGVATGKVIPLLKELGDISGGNKEHMQALSLVLGQASAAGHLMGQDLMQFNSAGWNPLQDLAEISGKSMAEVKEKMSKGQITFEDITKAMQHATSEGGRFYGMMDAQSKTVSGKFSTLKDTITSNVTDMFKKIKEPINSLLDMSINIVPKIMNIISVLFGKIISGIKFIIQYRQEFAILAGVIATVWAVTKAYGAALVIYHGVMTAVTVVTKGWAAAQAVLNFVMSLNPIVWLIAGIGALIAAVVICWNKFAGFRAVVLTVWDTLKGFGNIIKTYVIDRISTLLSGLGKVGDALSRLFHGDFKGAWQSAVAGYKDISGISSARKISGKTKNLVSGISSTYRKNYRAESIQQKVSKSGKSFHPSVIKQPEQKGSEDYGKLFGSGTDKKKKKKKGGRKTAEEMTTGGTRNTSINVRIGKFFDNINVMMADKTDTAELQRIIVQTMNRALAIATSTDR
jgi:tape measure domain-containing protein